MTDNVIPFQRPGSRRQPTADTARRDALPDEALHGKTRQASLDARRLAAAQAGEQRRRYVSAQMKQKNERLIATGKVVPARITMALDMRGLEGPEVDVACGAQEPDVDLWECGLSTPTAEQVQLLSDLTSFPVAYFYQPIEPGPLPGGVGRCPSCRACPQPSSTT